MTKQSYPGESRAEKFAMGRGAGSGPWDQRRECAFAPRWGQHAPVRRQIKCGGLFSTKGRTLRRGQNRRRPAERKRDESQGEASGEGDKENAVSIAGRGTAGERRRTGRRVRGSTLGRSYGNSGKLHARGTLGAAGAFGAGRSETEALKQGDGRIPQAHALAPSRRGGFTATRWSLSSWRGPARIRRRSFCPCS